MVKVLLNRLTSTTDTKRHAITRDLLLHAMYRTDTFVFEAIVHWMTKVPNFHGKLS
jgi:hypothetical protein